MGLRQFADVLRAQPATDSSVRRLRRGAFASGAFEHVLDEDEYFAVLQSYVLEYVDVNPVPDPAIQARYEVGLVRRFGRTYAKSSLLLTIVALYDPRCVGSVSLGTQYSARLAPQYSTIAHKLAHEPSRENKGDAFDCAPGSELGTIGSGGA